MATIDAKTLNERTTKRNALLNSDGGFRQQNILDHYVTYSYQHFIIASNNSEGLRQVQNKEVTFESISRKKHGETINSGSSSPVIMILNSTLDSKFFITSLTYDSLFINTSDPKRISTAETNMHMIIREAGGATFINYLRTVADEKLQCGFDSICMQLYTFFVGHTADGQSETISIDPIGIQIANIEGSFDHSGGTYSMTLCATENGAPFQKPSTFYSNRNFNLVIDEKDMLLSHALKNLEKKLNDVLDKEWQLAKAASGGNGRKVKYKFTWPESWDEEKYTVAATTKDNYIEKLFDKEKSVQQETTSTVDKNPNNDKKPTISKDVSKTYLNFSIKLSIPQILAELFKHCKQLHDAIDGNSKGLNNPPKLHQVVGSTTSDLNGVTVHVDIMDYYLPDLEDNKNATVQRKGQTVPDDVSAIGLEFDYIFTGKNTDIITLEMKTNYASQILQNSKRGLQEATGSYSQTLKTVASAQADENKSVDKKPSAPVIPIRKYDPIYLSTLPADAEQGYIYAAPDEAKSRQEYLKTIANSFTWANMQAHITIRGNPIFLKQMIKPILPHDDTAYEQWISEYHRKAKDKANKKGGDFDPRQTTSYMGDVNLCVPLFVKINVLTPREDGSGYEPFWYNGWWMVRSVSTKFSEGEFTQDLYLLPYGDQSAS